MALAVKASANRTREVRAVARIASRTPSMSQPWLAMR